MSLVYPFNWSFIYYIKSQKSILMSDTDLFESDEDIPEKNTTDDRNTSSILNNFDIVPGTPQKPTKTKFRKVKEYNPNECSNQFDSYTKYFKNDCEFLNSHIMRKTPYVFFKIKEVSAFNDRHCPLNNNLKLIGMYKVGKCGMHFLFEHQSQSKNKIFLDVKYLGSLPKQGETIELFGCLQFNSGCLIFVVHFWRLILGNIYRYVKMLTYQRCFVPLVYKQLQICDNNVTELSYNHDMEDDFCFEDIDESFLNRHVDEIEKIHSEFEDIMKISEDVFM